MKVDKGFEWNYWKLSYRRKLIRTLWTLPSVVLASASICYNLESIFKKVVFILILVMIGAIQLIYNYKKYQTEKIKQGT